VQRFRTFMSLGAALSVTLIGSGPGLGTSYASTGGGGQQLQRVGSVDLRSLSSPKLRSAGALDVSGETDSKATGASAVPVPNPSNRGVTHNHPGATGFNGLDAVDSGLLNGFDLEPPDQGLCAANGVVMEQVNLAAQVFTDRGSALTDPVSLNAFFDQPPLFDPSTQQFGPFLSDPRCYYDPQTGRWFATVLSIDLTPDTGDFGDASSLLIAVSTSSDPAGSYTIFAIDTTFTGKDGSPSFGHCPCFGDQPRIGADANGFYVASDIYPIHGLFNSHGGILFALSKRGLAAAANGAQMPTLVTIHSGAVRIGGEPSNALQPASTPPGGTYAANTEYFLTTPDFNGFATSGGKGAHALSLWALTGTRTLDNRNPDVHLKHTLVPSEPYAPPVPARQKSGPHPLGKSLGEPLPHISANDDRMQQVVYTAGRLVSSLNTGVGPGGAANRDAAAWFVVRPHVGNGDVSGSVSAQGYLAVAGNSVAYPAIGLDASGTGAMVFTLTGRDSFPSAAYTAFTLGGAKGAVHVIGEGVAPEDGFTCYPPYSDGVCRWGDYSAAVAEDGAIVMGTEYIPGPRDENANWGTFVTRYSLS
jgi:hypothetical protein